jgi:hypothetical protein
MKPPLEYHVAGGISEERQALTARNLVLYQNKRKLINALEMLDIVEDAELINKISTSLPQRVWKIPDRKYWRE